MSKSERSSNASVTTIWSVGVLDEERVRICTGNGVSRIIVGGFDVHVPGEFGGDAEKVLEAYKLQMEELEKTFANMPPDSDQPSRCEDNCGLIPISDEELDAEIREFESQCKVISLKTRQAI